MPRFKSHDIASRVPGYGEDGKSYMSFRADNVLDSRELKLFSHYMSHTSRIIALDEEDLYALQVGIPNLAIHSKPLMSSVLALAATCESHDILNQETAAVPNKHRIRDLLIFAEQHHRASLLQVQTDLPNLDEYDYILANAALMVLYATASHCLRIRLCEMQLTSAQLLREFVPAQSQWISLIRAAHLAFTGMLHSDSKPVKIGQESIPASLPSGNIQTQSAMEAIYPEDGSSGKTRDFLFPIIASSSGPAFEALRMKAERFRVEGATNIQRAHVNDVDNLPCVPDYHHIGIQACFKSLRILEGIVREIFSTEDSFSSAASSTNQLQPKPEPPLSGRLSTVPLWLRDYLARVTSSVSAPRPLRRVVMAFLNRVPAVFLNLVQTTLDSIGMQTGDSGQEGWGSLDPDLMKSLGVHKLAMDIFAHWFVLVMLLDGVWWIGGIGAWELGRIVCFTQSQGWLDSTIDSEKRWWPESMYRIGMELHHLACTK